MILSLHAGPDPLAGVVRSDHGPLREHVAPLLKEDELAELVCLGFRRVGRWRKLETLPPRRKAAGGGIGGLPEIEVGPGEVP